MTEILFGKIVDGKLVTTPARQTIHPLKVTKDSDDAKNWTSEVYKDSNWPLVFIIRCQYCEYWDSEWAKQGKYHFSINAVSPKAAKKKIDSACQSMSMSREDFDKYPIEVQAEILLDYGTAATLWQRQGNNMGKLLKAAKEELGVIWIMFGFYMDKPLNAIGSTGWDWIRGDILGGLKKRSK